MFNQQTKFTVKGLKTWNTDDGGGCQGYLLADGQKVAYFHDDGNGGEMRSDYEKGMKEPFEAFIATLPSIHVNDVTIRPDFGIFVDSIINATMKEKFIDSVVNRTVKNLATKTIFKYKGETCLRSVKYNWNQYSDALRKCSWWHKVEVCYNDMPIDKAKSAIETLTREQYK